MIITSHFSDIVEVDEVKNCVPFSTLVVTNNIKQSHHIPDTLCRFFSTVKTAVNYEINHMMVIFTFCFFPQQFRGGGDMAHTATS